MTALVLYGGTLRRKDDPVLFNAAEESFAASYNSTVPTRLRPYSLDALLWHTLSDCAMRRDNLCETSRSHSASFYSRSIRTVAVGQLILSVQAQQCCPLRSGFLLEAPRGAVLLCACCFYIGSPDCCLLLFLIALALVLSFSLRHVSSLLFIARCGLLLRPSLCARSGSLYFHFLNRRGPS